MEEKAGRPIRPVDLPFPDTHSLTLPRIPITKTYYNLACVHAKTYIKYILFYNEYIMPES